MKKVLALVLVAVMAFGLTLTTFAADPKVTGFYYNDGLAGGYGTDIVKVWGKSGNTYAVIDKVIGKGTLSHAYANQTVTYGSKIVPYDKVKDYINLYLDLFTWDGVPAYALRYNDANPPQLIKADGTVLGANEDINLAVNWNTLISSKDIRNSKLAVRTSVSAGSKAIESVTIDSKIGAIAIKYATEWVSVKELDFEFTVYLTINGKRQDDFGLTFVGTLANEITEVYANDDYVDTSYGQVAYAQEFVPKIQVDLGNGVSIHTKFFKEKKYYGTASRDADAADDVVFTKYPDVDNVVTLKTVGLNSTGDIVKLSTDYSDYYVYDKDLNYLGQSNQMLPYSTKYYLANRKLDIVDDEIDTEPGDAPTTDGGDGPETGGDDAVISNANGNPSTGR